MPAADLFAFMRIFRAVWSHQTTLFCAENLIDESRYLG